jgi:maltose O-acetyltransferase
VTARRRLFLLLYYGIGSRLPSSNFPFGSLWRSLRASLCHGLFASAAKRINVESNVFVADGRYVTLGSGSGLGRGSQVFGAIIGENVMVGPEVVFLKDNHCYDDPAVPMQSQGRTQVALPVVEDGAWIGQRAMILPGRRVGEGAIVGAGAVVTRDVPAFEIVGGNPARSIGRRPRPTESDRLPLGDAVSSAAIG